MRLIDAVRSRIGLLHSRADSDARFSHEVAFHIEMETDRLCREEGLDESEARRRALVAFGGVENYKEAMRDARGIRWIGGLTLDFKLGLRMMARWPGLTVVGVIGMAVAVAIGTFSYGLINMLIGPTVPIDEGHRVVVIENWDARSSRDRGETHLHDMREWRTSIEAVEELSAYRIVKRNIIVPGSRPEPVQIAEMTASGFGVARVAPLMGRFLLEEDEKPGALPVVVIGYDVWQARFGGATDILRRTLQIANAKHLVVGVMPEGFLFPVNNRIWVPLQLDPLRFEQGNAPAIKVFGRLAEGASIDDAKSQASGVTTRLAASRPEKFAAVRTLVMDYGRSFSENPALAWALQLVKLVVSLLLVVIGINVATLVFARTAGRMGEIAVRTALGASRMRIVLQLFSEALVLALVAAGAGFVGAVFAHRYLGAHVQRLSGDQLPYWFSFEVSIGMILYVLALAVVAAFLIGVLPALKATGRNVRGNLQALGGGAGIRLGKSWTTMIIAQVAVAVALLPMVVHVALVRPETDKATLPHYDTSPWLTLTALLDPPEVRSRDATARDTTFAVHFTQRTGELIRRLQADAAITDVVRMSAVPGAEPITHIETDGSINPLADRDREPPSGISSAGYLRVEPKFFAAFDIPLLMGRSLQTGDEKAANIPVVVNQPFVDRMFGGQNAIGRRVRIPAIATDDPTDKAGPWHEIVGVVPDFPGRNRSSARHPMLYRAIEPVSGVASTLAVRSRDAALPTITGRMREVAMSVDPMMRLEDIRTLEDAMSIEDVLDRVIFTAVLLVTLSVVMLSAAGIYALMSFTIAKRRREIGIRAALGAGARQIVGGVLVRAARQIVIGIVLGSFFALLLLQTVEGWKFDLRGMSSIIGVVVFMVAVGLAAAWGPSRAALRIQPTEALRSE